MMMGEPVITKYFMYYLYRNNFFEVVLHVLFNRLSWNFSEDFTISLKSHVVDGSAELIMHSDFTAAW